MPEASDVHASLQPTASVLPDMSALQAQLRSEPESAPGLAKRRLLTFRLADQTYGISLAAVKEIVPLPLLSRPPGMPSVLAGFFELEGAAIAVLRLDVLFGVANHATHLYTPLLVLQNLGLPLAVMVEEVSGIVSSQMSSIVPVPENTSFNECTEGVLATTDRHIVVLSAERLLLKAEQQRLADFAALEQRRLADVAGGES